MSVTGKKTDLRPLFKLALSLGLLAFFLSRIGWSQVWSGLAGAHYGWVLSAAAAYGLGVIVRALRWQALIRAYGADVSLWRLARLSFVGFYFNAFLPTGYGGDVVRAVEAARIMPGPVAVSSLVADRAIGLFGICLLALAALPLNLRGGDPSLRLMGAAAGAVAAALFIGFWLLTRTEFVGWALARAPFLRFATGSRGTTVSSREERGTGRGKVITKGTDGPVGALKGYTLRNLAGPLVYALIFGFTNALTYALIGQAVRVEAPFSYYLLASPLITLVLLIPLAFNGVGTRDAAYLLLFTPLGVPAAAALAMSLLYHVLNLLAALAGGAVYLGMTAAHDKVFRS